MKDNLTKDKSGRLRCSKFKSCGGCSYDFDYSEQLVRKQRKADRLLSRFGRVEKIAAMESPYFYRTKVTRVYTRAGNGRLVCGVFKSKSGSCVPVKECMLEDRRLCEIAFKLADVFTALKITPYDYRSGRGELRQVLLKKGSETGEIMLCIVTNSKALKNKNALVKMICDRFPDVTTIVHNICKSPMPLTLGDEQQVLYGKGIIRDTILGKSFKISAKSFMQVNAVQTKKLYSFAKGYLGRADTLIDAYCGTGTIGLICCDNVNRLYGTEIVSGAVKDAVQNAKDNDIKNAEFVCKDAKVFIKEFLNEGLKADAVILDPPRAGADRRFLESLIKLAPGKIIYISCGIDTLARDLCILTKGGYAVKRIQPVDMFAHTTHIENVVELEKRIKGEKTI
ncbi:MAG: 23S rRNA (uracil(1939)-C(5))-methyltransferase RlmD [Ruminococcus sp.]|nr:23S rRNA (uracil(1939)-C(5))-methyltransferase RlmD [Ruminococcus sp.]